jgi:hypothetical protein
MQCSGVMVVYRVRSGQVATGQLGIYLTPFLIFEHGVLTVSWNVVEWKQGMLSAVAHFCLLIDLGLLLPSWFVDIYIDFCTSYKSLVTITACHYVSYLENSFLCFSLLYEIIF